MRRGRQENIPVSMISRDLASMRPPSLQELIIHQVHYYFSPENLYRDDFLKGHMDPREGWLPIRLLATFNRLRSLTADVDAITEALKQSPELEVFDGQVRKRRDAARHEGQQVTVVCRAVSAGSVCWMLSNICSTFHSMMSGLLCHRRNA